jgi:peptide/nickel transport system substrate-binding protein
VEPARGEGGSAIKLRILSILVAAALAASACTGGSAAKVEGLPAGHGGTLTVVMTQTGGSPYAPGAFDPQASGYPASLEVARCCLFRTLLSYNGQPTSGGGAVPSPDLAEGLPSVSTDRLTWTFHVRAGIHYAPPLQNTEVVAQDFIRGLERELLPVTGKTARTTCGGTPCQLGGYYAQFLLGSIQGAQEYGDGKTTTISGLEAPNPHTLVVRLTRPTGDLAYLFALQGTAPIPPKPGDPTQTLGVAQGHDLNYGRGFAVGSGPYMVEGSAAVDFSLPADQQSPPSGAATGSFTLVRNPSWDPGTDPLRVAYADRIVVIGAKSVAEGEQWVQQGKADLVGDWYAPLGLVQRYQSSPELRNQVFTDPSDALSTLTLNLAVPPLDDIHVRTAIELAINRSALAPILASTGFIQVPSTVATHIAPDALENDLLQNYAPPGFKNDGNLQAAAAEMAKSRYDSNGDGVCDSFACRGISLIVPGDAKERILMAESIKRDLAPLGIDISVTKVDHGTTYFQDLADPSARPPIILIAFAKDYPSGTDMFAPIFASKNLVNGLGDPSLLGATSRQLSRWGYAVRSVPSVDDRIQQCQEEAFAAQVACWASFDQYLMQDVVPWAPLLSWTGSCVVSDRVTKFSFDQSTPFPSPALDRIALAPTPADTSP